AAAALSAAGEGALGAFRYAEAIDLARRALAYEPYAEPAARLLMRAAALSGDIAGALAAFQDFSARMASQLGERPGRALSDLAERVRSMRWRRSTALRAAEEPALVGREALYREAFAVVEAGLRGGPRTLLVTGDPGAGGTRPKWRLPSPRCSARSRMSNRWASAWTLATSRMDRASARSRSRWASCGGPRPRWCWS